MNHLPLVVATATLSILAAACSGPAGDQPALVAPSSSATTSTQTPSSTSPSTTPTPKPKLKPVNPALYFWGPYDLTATVTKTTSPHQYRKGSREKGFWDVSSRCAKKCASRIDKGIKSANFTLTYSHHRWRGTHTYKVGCVYTDTGKKAGPDVRMRDSYVLKQTRSKDAVATRLEGTNHLRQLDECGGLDRVTYRLVLTHR